MTYITSASQSVKDMDVILMMYHNKSSPSCVEDNGMRLTKRQLKRIIREEYTRLKRRGLIREHGYGVDYPTGTSFDGDVTLELDTEGDLIGLDIAEFNGFCQEFGGCDHEQHSPGVYLVTGSFDALWNGWVNCCGDEPDEFMVRVVSGHENCPEL